MHFKVVFRLLLTSVSKLFYPSPSEPKTSNLTGEPRLPKSADAEPSWKRALSEAIEALPITEKFPASIRDKITFLTLNEAVSRAAEHIEGHYGCCGAQVASFRVGCKWTSRDYRYSSGSGETVSLNFGFGYSHSNLSITKHGPEKYSIY